MSRIMAGVVFGAILFAALIYTTLDQTGVDCKVCIDFEGRSACESASAPDRVQARMQATTGACTRLSSGVTDSMRCGRASPTLVECSE
jgi:hypothetical protein